MEQTPTNGKSDFISNEILQEAIRFKETCEDVIVKIVKVEELSLNNLVSSLFRVELHGVQNGYNKEHKLFIKRIRNSKTLLHIILTKSTLYHKEEMVYRQIIPDMVKYQANANLAPQELDPSVPSFYYSLVNKTTGIIVLEDVQSLGYVTNDRKSCLNFEQCKLALSEMARFHALSLAMKDGHVNNLRKYKFLFQDGGDCLTTHLSPFLANGFKTSLQIIQSFTKDIGVRLAADKLSEIDALEALRELSRPKEPFALICHGDATASNVVFKYNEETKKPIAAMLVDFQSVRYALPTTDLSYFLFISTDRNLRKQHMKSLLLYYHTTFIECLRNVKVECPEFAFHAFEKMLQQTAMFGILFALMLLPVNLATDAQRNSLHLSGTSKDKLESTFAEYFKQILEHEENLLIIEKRIRGVLEDAIEMRVV